MHKLIKTSCAIASEDIGREKADKIALAAQKRYEELCTENSADSKALRAHTYRRIYPSIAVYESFKAEGVGPEQAAWYIREYFQQVAERAVPHIQRMIRFLGLAEKIPKLFTGISVRSFGTDAGFVYEFPARKGNEARFNIISCPYYETCKRYGCPEITHVFCDGDDAGYGHLHPKLIWGRTKTIGRGDDCCNFLLEYKDR